MIAATLVAVVLLVLALVAQHLYYRSLLKRREIGGRGKLENQMELLANAVESSRDMMTISGLDDCFTFVNQAFLDEYGYTREELIGQHVSILDSPDNPEDLRQQIFDGTRRGSWSGELWNRRKDGSYLPIALSTSQITDQNGKVLGLIGVATNLTEKKQREERSRYEASHDALTSLPNRRALAERLALSVAQAQRRTHPLAVLCLDLDRFKRINDTLSHEVADALLVDVGERLRLIVRLGDTVGRFGGDEFVIVAADARDSSAAENLAAKVIESFTQPFHIEGQELFVTASVGVAVHPRDGTDGETLMKNADLAMCRAKSLGGNRYEFASPATHTEIALAHLTLENALRRGMRRDEFVPHYQAQVGVRAGGVVAAEALLRWNHPDRGIVSAHEFIEVAEETSLIVEMGECVLRQAVRQLAVWQRDLSPSLRVAVNISAQQFADRRLAAILREVLSDSRIDPSTLELEITETLAMRDIDETLRILRDVKDLGVRVAIDDFGIGHSSLNYLRSFPIDCVKIDRSFIRPLAFDSQGVEIMAMIISMAHRLELNVVAEGVETHEQRTILHKHGCDDMQGYLIHKPTSAAQFSTWYAAQVPGSPASPVSAAG